jgi:phenol hydroxylase P2 protein
MGNVSITFQDTENGRRIAEAVLADNPQATVSTMPSMLRIDAAGRLVVNRASVENLIGRTWDVQEMQLDMISLAGNVDEDDDRFVLEWKG